MQSWRVTNGLSVYFYRPISKTLQKFDSAGKKQLTKKLELLAENPLHPSLRTKRIQGTKDLFECSVNMDIRIIWYYEGDKMIILLDVGHHDILKGF